MQDWIDVLEDEPLLGKGYKRCSVDINVLTATGKIIKNAFMTLDDQEFYNSDGRRIREEVVAWQTAS